LRVRSPTGAIDDPGFSEEEKAALTPAAGASSSTI